MSSHVKGFNTELKSKVREAEVWDKAERAKIYGKLRQKRYIPNKLVCRNILFPYQLYRGDSKFPRIENITIYEAFDRNKKLEDSYMSKLSSEGQNTTAHLWSWQPVDRKKQGLQTAILINKLVSTDPPSTNKLKSLAKELNLELRNR